VHWLTAVSTLPRRFCAPSARPDLVVISGDIADSALPEEYAHATKLLGALQVPFVAIPSNHDRRPLIRETFPDPAYGTADCALNTLRRIDGLDILLIDSTVAGAPHGELDAPTLS
jgi:3',5'-cyclic-AMP phosphodiesterase